MKCILCILAALLMTSALCFAQEGFIFYYDFNADQVGSLPSGDWKPTAEGKVEVAAIPSASNKSVKITDTGLGGGMQIIMSSPIKNKTVTLEFKVMREAGWTVACEIFYAMNQKCPDDWSGICIKDGDGGSMDYHDGVNWITSLPFTDGVWHDFRIVCYLDRDKYDLYYDGQEIARDVGYRKWDGLAGAGIDKFNVANVGDGGSTFVKYFDDIVLYEGTTRPSITPVNAGSKLTTRWGDIKVSMSDQAFMEYKNGHRSNRYEKGTLPLYYTKFITLSR